MVLAVEADEAERLLAADHDGEAARALARAEEAMRQEVRGDDVVVREHPGRLWLVAPKVDPADARVFAERLAAAVTRSASLHGSPLTISIGIAVCPDDGTSAEALVAHADEGVFAARAAGVRLA
jgi:diguanylate cyclase (GGDEF)-like protein